MKAGLLHYAFWIAGDEAYICTESLITPFSASPATDWHDSFKFWHSSLRMHVEQAFGILMPKWRILQYLSFTVETNIHIVLIAMKLHNFLIDEEGILKPIPTIETFDRVAVQSEDWYAQAKEDLRNILREQGNGAEYRSSSVSRKRERVVEVVRTLGLMRPVPSSAIVPHF